jgi:hypothetical protein
LKHNFSQTKSLSSTKLKKLCSTSQESRKLITQGQYHIQIQQTASHENPLIQRMNSNLTI